MYAPITRIVSFLGVFGGKARWLVQLTSGAVASMTAAEVALATNHD